MTSRPEIPPELIAAAGPDALGSPVPRAMATFEDVELITTADDDAIVFRHEPEESFVQMGALGVSTAAFVLFVIVVLPFFDVTASGTALWLFVGLTLLAVIGFATHARTHSTQLRIDAKGITLDQGSTIDREHVVIVWSELAGVEIEPVNPTDGREGMMLRLSPRVGEPIDAFATVSVGDLSEIRRAIADGLQKYRSRETT